MPIADRFDFLDLIFFFKVVKGLVPVELPPYLTLYQGNTRLRSSHLDSLCYISSLSPRTATNAFARSFFFRTHTKWNHIPLDIRETSSIELNSSPSLQCIISGQPSCQKYMMTSQMITFEAIYIYNIYTYLGPKNGVLRRFGDV